MASYGVLMKAATNTLSSWHPTDDHGTTLHALGLESRLNWETHANGGSNRGFAFEMIKRMKGPAIPQDILLFGQVPEGQGLEPEARWHCCHYTWWSMLPTK